MTEVLASRYELGATLGVGGMGRVVEGFDRVLDRRVAVKLLAAGADDRVRRRFVREAQAAASFTHPNAVTTYDAGEDDGRGFIVMELVEGRTLADELAAHGPLAEGRALAIAREVLAALGAAHRAGLVHRDVKPGNILLPHAGGVKLSDFGIAKSLQEGHDLTTTGHVLGTPRYLSPEQVAGQSASPRSDLYALGVVLYEMLAGEPPFDRDTPLAIAVAHQRDEPPPLTSAVPGVSAGLAAAVHRALAKDPQQRFASAEEMAAALERPEPAAPTVAVPVARSDTLVLPAADRPPRQVPWWVGVAAAALVVLALLALARGRTAEESPPAAEDAEPAQAEQAAPPPPEDEPDPDPEPEPQEPGPPDDLGSLIALLAGDPEAAGEKGDDLLDQLVKVSRERGKKQRDEAEDTIKDIEDWVEDGELDPEIGALAISILEPYADPPGRRDADDDD